MMKHIFAEPGHFICQQLIAICWHGKMWAKNRTWQHRRMFDTLESCRHETGPGNTGVLYDIPWSRAGPGSYPSPVINKKSDACQLKNKISKISKSII